MTHDTESERGMPELPGCVAHVHSGGDLCWDMSLGGDTSWPVDLFTGDQMRAYALAAIEKDRAERSEAVPDGIYDNETTCRREGYSGGKLSASMSMESVINFNGDGNIAREWRKPWRAYPPLPSAPPERSEAAPVAEVRWLTNKFGTWQAAFLLDKTVSDGTPLYTAPPERSDVQGAETCKQCGGTGVVDDGEIDNGYENGPIKFVKDYPIKFVKDCPACASRPAVQQEGCSRAEVLEEAARLCEWRGHAIDNSGKSYVRSRDALDCARAIRDLAAAPGESNG